MGEVKKLSDIDISDLYMMVKDALPNWNVKVLINDINSTVKIINVIIKSQQELF